MIINAENLIVGRMATFIAKKALLGETIDVLNCEKAVITGSRENIFARYKEKRERGQPYHGPNISRNPAMIVKRMIRGMLPYKQAKGREAFSRIKCYVGVPDEFKEKKLQAVEQAKMSRASSLRFITLSEASKSMGGR